MRPSAASTLAELLSVDHEPDQARTRDILEQKVALIERKVSELAQWRQHLQQRMAEQPHVDAPMRTLLNFFSDASSDVMALEVIERSLRDAHEEG